MQTPLFSFSTTRLFNHILVVVDYKDSCCEGNCSPTLMCLIKPYNRHVLLNLHQTFGSVKGKRDAVNWQQQVEETKKKGSCINYTEVGSDEVDSLFSCTVFRLREGELYWTFSQTCSKRNYLNQQNNQLLMRSCFFSSKNLLFYSSRNHFVWLSKHTLKSISDKVRKIFNLCTDNIPQVACYLVYILY